MTNKQLIEKQFVEIFNKGNLAYAEEVCSPTLMLHDVTFQQATLGPEAVKQFAHMYREAFPDLNVVIEEILEQDNKVAVLWKATGTHQKPLFGIAPTKKFYTITGQSFYKVAKGYITEIFVQWDVIKLLREMKVELPIKLETEIPV